MQTIYHLPPAIEKQVNRAIFQFIWAGKNELVSRKTMFQTPDKGGQGLVDKHLKTNALHLNLLQSIIDTNYDSPWVYVARYNIGFQLFKYFPTAKFIRSNLFPHALTPSPHYTRLLSLCNLYKVVVASLSAAGTHVSSIYDSILASVYSGINHVFIDCPIAVAVFAFLQPIFEQLLGTFSVLPSLVIFFEFPNGIHQNAKTLCRCLLKITLYSIWMHRCDRRFEKKPPNPLGVVSSIKDTIRKRIKFTFSSPFLFAKEFPILVYNGVVCSYQNGTLSFKI